MSAFSGWEPEEFRVDKLRSRDDDTNFFGITFSNDRVAGFLSQDITSIISQQWQRVQSMLPNLEVLDFESHMDDRKNTDWYQSAMNNVKQQTGKVAIFGEEELKTGQVSVRWLSREGGEAHQIMVPYAELVEFLHKNKSGNRTQ